MSAGKGKRRAVATGIYQDRYGFEATVGKTRHFKQQSRRYPPDAKLSVMQRWQLDIRSARLTEHPTGGSTRGTLEADVPAYLKTIPAGSTRRRDETILLGHWIRSPLGTMRRSDITRADIKAQLAAWEAAGAKASTLNHRLRALRSLYRELDGDDRIHPTDKIRKRREPTPEPRAVPLAVAHAILAQLRLMGRKGAKHESATAIRLRVMLTTGLPHTQLQRLARRDVDFEGARFYARPRRKGKGTRGVWLPLLPHAIEALSAYDAAGLWERPFSRSAMHSAFARAVAKIQAAAQAAGVVLPLPPNLRPYDFRHVFLTEVYRATGDQRAAQALGQHADIRTTRRYTEGAVDERAAAAIALVAAGWDRK